MSGSPHIVKDYTKMRNISKIFLRSFENVGPDVYIMACFLQESVVARAKNDDPTDKCIMLTR